MKYTIENEKLKITVNSLGAELCSVVCKEDGAEHIWEGDPAVWEGQAPILFPYTSVLPEGKFTVDGKVYEGEIHGFARRFEHTMVRCESNVLALELVSCPATLEKWPFAFRLESTFRLEGDTLHHSLRVKNTGDRAFTFGIGFHPAFAIPFDSEHTYKDYELRFDKLESPICLLFNPEGVVSYYLGKNIRQIPIDDQLFRDGSHLMVGLQSETLGIYEKDSQRAVVCDISGAPYNLIWSKPGTPRFVCIEPWQSTPSPITEDLSWENKPATACLAPGESYKVTMKTTFKR